MDELTALRARVAQLEDAHAALASELDRLRALLTAPERSSMRDARRCRACGGRTILHVPGTTQVGEVTTTPFGLSYYLAFTGWRVTGAMETFACRTCGIVEFHVKSPDDVKPDGNLVRAIDPEPEPPRDGPFR
jgi:hypothetical protein